MLSQSLPNACNSNFKGSLRPRLSFHWSFLSLHSKFMCRVELQGSFKPLKWFAEQPVELECGRCLNHLWTSLSRRGAVFVNSYYCSMQVTFLVTRPHSGLQAATWQMRSFRFKFWPHLAIQMKGYAFRQACSICFNFNWQLSDYNEVICRVVAIRYLWSVTFCKIPLSDLNGLNTSLDTYYV